MKPHQLTVIGSICIFKQKDTSGQVKDSENFSIKNV